MNLHAKFDPNRPSHLAAHATFYRYISEVYYCVVQHPGIEPTLYATCNSSCTVVIRKYYEHGTVRDLICNVSYYSFILLFNCWFCTLHENGLLYGCKIKTLTNALTR